MVKLMNINHVTLTTAHILRYKDDSVITADAREAAHHMAIKVIEDGVIDVLDGIKLRCAVEPEKKCYVAMLYSDDPFFVPIIETSGAVDEQGGKYQWGLMEDLQKIIFDEETQALYPGTPFICDIVFPSQILRIDVLMWSGFFAKCFGIEMLKVLSEYK